MDAEDRDLDVELAEMRRVLAAGKFRAEFEPRIAIDLKVGDAHVRPSFQLFEEKGDFKRRRWVKVGPPIVGERDQTAHDMLQELTNLADPAYVAPPDVSK